MISPTTRFFITIRRLSDHVAAMLPQIAATKAAGQLGLPVFVILQKGSRRSVRRGWVIDWDDAEDVFLVEFGPLPSNVVSGDAVDTEPFELFEDREDVFRRTRGRANQQRFKFQVTQRYGGQCAVCDSQVLEWLDAAHLVADAERGSSDPRNGILFCKNHHAAFDRRLLAIDPSGRIFVRQYSTTDLGVSRPDLSHLPNGLPRMPCAIDGTGQDQMTGRSPRKFRHLRSSCGAFTTTQSLHLSVVSEQAPASPRSGLTRLPEVGGLPVVCRALFDPPLRPRSSFG